MTLEINLEKIEKLIKRKLTPLEREIFNHGYLSGKEDIMDNLLVKLNKFSKTKSI